MAESTAHRHSKNTSAEKVARDALYSVSMHHEHFMRRCLKLAEQGRGNVGNGALVGAVLVRGGTMIAEGIYDHFGGDHAERRLLEQYQAGIDMEDVLYVNLEPCCHQGKTPPCTDIIVKRGVRHVVYGMTDPDERVRGEGLKRLRAAGVKVTGPVLLSECERLNRGFLSVRLNGRPWITLKVAQTLDGRTQEPHERLHITTREQDAWSHMWLRGTHDAILVGVQTVLRDNPILDTRLDTKMRGYRPWRIVLDPKVRTPLTSHIVTGEHAQRTIVVHAPIVTKEDEVAAEELQKRRVFLLEVPLSGNVFAWDLLWKKLTMPTDYYHGLTSILVEGGPTTWQHMRKAGCVDEEVLLVGA